MLVINKLFVDDMKETIYDTKCERLKQISQLANDSKIIIDDHVCIVKSYPVVNYKVCFKMNILNKIYNLFEKNKFFKFVVNEFVFDFFLNNFQFLRCYKFHDVSFFFCRKDEENIPHKFFEVSEDTLNKTAVILYNEIPLVKDDDYITIT